MHFLKQNFILRNEVFIIIYIIFFILLGISIYLGLSKSLIKKNLFLIYSSIMIVVSLISSLFLKSIFLYKLNASSKIEPLIDYNFIDWAMYRFDTYFKWSYVYVIAILAVLLFALYNDKNIRTQEGSTRFSYLAVLSTIVMSVASLIYSLSLLNTYFNIAIYILTLTFLQIFILHLPLVARRLYIGNPVVESTYYGC